MKNTIVCGIDGSPDPLIGLARCHVLVVPPGAVLP